MDHNRLGEVTVNITPTNRPSIGCFGVVRTNTFIAPAIRLLTRSQVNHAFVVVRKLQDGDWLVVESQRIGARLARLSKWADLEVVFSDPLPGFHGANVASEARALVGTPYNFLDIAALALLMCGLRWNWLLRRAQSSKRLICSQLVDRAYRNADVHLYEDTRPDGEVTPGDLLMFIAQGLKPDIGRRNRLPWNYVDQS